MTKALAAAKALKRRGLKQPSIEKEFSAASSRDSKSESEGEMLSLTAESLKALASALSEGGHKAGEGYLVEAKLWHVEEGFTGTIPWIGRLGSAREHYAEGRVQGKKLQKSMSEPDKTQPSSPICPGREVQQRLLRVRYGC